MNETVLEQDSSPVVVVVMGNEPDELIGELWEEAWRSLAARRLPSPVVNLPALAAQPARVRHAYD